jgi:uncharacterized protein
VVVDTNVWISGLLSPLGAPALLTRQVLRRAWPAFTEATFAELSQRLWRPKFDRYVSMDMRKHWLADLSAVGEPVAVPADVEALKFCRDAADDKFIHAALVVEALCLVTGDQDLLVLADPLQARGVRVLTPAAALALPLFSDPG